MRSPRKTADEQYALIMECRSSGLSDQQWCMQHDINPGTFYNWVKRLRRKACYDIMMRRELSQTVKREGSPLSRVPMRDILAALPDCRMRLLSFILKD